MAPIEKNIHVVDERGVVYEATWPRRARGLVKRGRARFLSEDTICLACPPNDDLEDTEMSDNKLEFEYYDFMSDYRSPWVFNKVLQKP